MNVRDRFRWVFANLRTTLKPAIRLQIGSTLIFVVTFVPATTWFLNALVARSGQYAVTDDDLIGFAATVPGLLFLLMSLSFVLTIAFAEQAALLVIIGHAMGGRRISISGLLYEQAVRLPGLLRLGVEQGAAYLALALPFIAGIGITYRLLLWEFDFYYYLNVQPRSWWIAVSITGALVAVYAAVAGWLYVRWMLAVVLLLFDDQSPREALRSSWQRTRGRAWSLASPLVLSWMIVLVLSAAMSWAVSAMAASIASSATDLNALVPIVLGTLALLAIIELAGLIVGKIVHVMLIAEAAGGDLMSPAEPTDQARGTRWVRAGWILGGLVATGTGAAAATTFMAEIETERKIDITAHRGAKRRAPENTLSAIRAAIDEGADFAEIDVQSTADGAVVLLHDADLMRVASVGRRVHQLTLAELADIDVGTWFDPAFGDERIPTLQQVIDLARDRIALNIELKYTWEDPDLARRVGELVRRNEFSSHCVVSSLNFRAVTEMRERYPEIPAGFIVFKAVGNVARMQADFLSISSAKAAGDRVRSIQRRGRAVHVWTVNDVSNALSMIEMGVDNIITDDPALIRTMLDDWNGLSPHEKVTLMLRDLIVGLDPPQPAEL
ncbi:MAG: glycerophosphodiester phosphodiesterase [Planctomycetota bacterium]|nr:glycerophosphodiester phosphodiesterase [Planctomycetota bacterium]